MAPQKRFAVCVDNTDYTAALEVRKIYQVLPDPAANSHYYVRIIDESGEDYLYPSRMFLPVKVRPEASTTLAKILSFKRRKNPKDLRKGHKGSRANQGSKIRRARSSKKSRASA
jgi:hypothetical protein